MKHSLFILLFVCLCGNASAQWYLGTGIGVTSAPPDPHWDYQNTPLVPALQLDYNVPLKDGSDLRLGMATYFRYGSHANSTIQYISPDSSEYTTYISKGYVRAIPLRLNIAHFLKFKAVDFYYGVGLEGDLYREVIISNYGYLGYGQIVQSESYNDKYFLGSRAKALVEAVWFRSGVHRDFGKRFYVEAEGGWNLSFLKKEQDAPYYRQNFNVFAMLRLGAKLGKSSEQPRVDSMQYNPWIQQRMNGSVSGRSSILSFSTLEALAGIYALGWEQQLNRNISIVGRAGLTLSEVDGLPWINNLHTGAYKYAGYYHWSSDTQTRGLYGFALSGAFRYYPDKNKISPTGLHFDASLGFRRYNYALTGVDANGDERLEERNSYQDNFSVGGELGYQIVYKRLSLDVIIGCKYGFTSENKLYSMQHWYDSEWHFYWDASLEKQAKPQGFLGVHLGYQLFQ